MKTITTGTKITFIENGEKFALTQTETGFDIKQVKLGKNIPSESYSFQELLALHESKEITFEGFEEGDAGLIHSIITNYIYQTNLKAQLAEISTLKSQYSILNTQYTEFQTAHSELQTAHSELQTAHSELQTAHSELQTEIEQLKKENTGLANAKEFMAEED